MSSQNKAPGVKSAYEAALERLEQQGIEKPKLDALSDKTRQEMAEVRSKTAAELAQLEIMHQQKMATVQDPLLSRQEEDEYQRERKKVEARRDDRIEALRRSSQ